MVTFLTFTRQFFLHTTPIDIINSWGISKMYATQIVKNINGEDFTMAVLVMQVNGFQFQGKIYIALDETVSMERRMEQQKNIIMILLTKVTKVKLKSATKKNSLGQRIVIPKNMRTFAVGLARRH